jgi:hypothetical protein
MMHLIMNVVMHNVVDAECCCIIMLSHVEYHDPDKLGRYGSRSYWVIKAVLK